MSGCNFSIKTYLLKVATLPCHYSKIFVFSFINQDKYVHISMKYIKLKDTPKDDYYTGSSAFITELNFN